MNANDATRLTAGGHTPKEGRGRACSPAGDQSSSEMLAPRPLCGTADLSCGAAAAYSLGREPQVSMTRDFQAPIGAAHRRSSESLSPLRGLLQFVFRFPGLRPRLHAAVPSGLKQNPRTS